MRVDGRALLLGLLIALVYVLVWESGRAFARKAMLEHPPGTVTRSRH